VLDAKLGLIKKLIAEREQIDAELSQLLGITEKTKRGRQPKNDESSGGIDTGSMEFLPAGPR
jgi:hypothetical protein